MKAGGAKRHHGIWRSSGVTCWRQRNGVIGGIIVASWRYQSATAAVIGGVNGVVIGGGGGNGGIKYGGVSWRNGGGGGGSENQWPRSGNGGIMWYVVNSNMGIVIMSYFA